MDNADVTSERQFGGHDDNDDGDNNNKGQVIVVLQIFLTLHGKHRF